VEEAIQKGTACWGIDAWVIDDLVDQRKIKYVEILSPSYRYRVRVEDLLENSWVNAYNERPQYMLNLKHWTKIERTVGREPPRGGRRRSDADVVQPRVDFEPAGRPVENPDYGFRLFETEISGMGKTGSSNPGERDAEGSSYGRTVGVGTSEGKAQRASLSSLARRRGPDGNEGRQSNSPRRSGGSGSKLHSVRRKAGGGA